MQFHTDYNKAYVTEVKLIVKLIKRKDHEHLLCKDTQSVTQGVSFTLILILNNVIYSISLGELILAVIFCAQK